MSGDSDAGEAGGRVVTVETDGVQVEKTFERDEFPVPVVSFVFTSSAEEPIELRLTDDIPESFPMEHVGFHPDFDSESWTAYRDHRVEFVCTLEPGEELRTVYGVRLEEGRSTDEFLAEPSIERRGEAADSDPDDVLGRETNQLVRDALAGEEVPGVEGSLDVGEADEPATDDDVPTTDDESAEESDEADESGEPEPRTVESDLTAAIQRDESEDGESDETESADGATDSTGRRDDAALPGSVAAALAAELRAGGVDDEDVETLKEHLDVETGVPTSVDVRLQRVQSKLADLDAYTDALASFLDENGTGQELIDGLTDDVEAVEAELSAIEDELETVRTDQRALREDVEDVEATVEDRAGALEAEVAERTDELERRVESVRDELDAELSTLDSDLGDVDSDVEDLSDRLDELEADVAETEAAEAEELDALAADVAGLREDIEALNEFRDRMRSAFGE